MVWIGWAVRLQCQYETSRRSSIKKKTCPTTVVFYWVEIVGHIRKMIDSLSKVIPRRVSLHLTCSCSATDQGCLWNMLNEGITGGCNLITTSQLWSKSPLVRGSESCISVCCSTCFVPHGTSLLLGKELIWGSSFLFPPFFHFFLFFQY